MIMSAELAWVAGPTRSVASCGVAIIVTFTPTCCMPFLSANAAVSAPGWFG
jgi:hypothetical protein